LTSEVVQTRYREGRPYRVWVLPDGRRNESLDTAVYALAARSATRIRLDLLPRSLPPAPSAPPDSPEGVPPVAAFTPVMPPPPPQHRLRRGRVIIRSPYLMRE
jgi:phage terminase large subunit GpA-like protein